MHTTDSILTIPGPALVVPGFEELPTPIQAAIEELSKPFPVEEVKVRLGLVTWGVKRMDTRIHACTWRRRGAEHAQREPRRKRERRPLGFLCRNAAALRHSMKCHSHRSARRASRARLRRYLKACAA